MSDAADEPLFTDREGHRLWRGFCERPGDAKLVVASPTARSMGVGRDLFALRKDGREVPVEIGLSPVTLDGRAFVLTSVVDISERKRQEDRFRMSLEAAPVGILMVDDRGRILQMPHLAQFDIQI